MKNLSRLFSKLAMAAIALSFIACEKDDDKEEEVVDMAFTTMQNNLDMSIKVVDEGVTGDTYGDATIPHGGDGLSKDETIRDIYSNTTSGQDYKTVITKRTYKKNTDGSKGDLLVTFAMVKHEAGYNPAANDWEWIKIPADVAGVDYATMPNGSLATTGIVQGKTLGCIGCHASAPGGDYSFVR